MLIGERPFVFVHLAIPMGSGVSHCSICCSAGDVCYIPYRLECKEQSIHSQSERRPGQASHGTRHPLRGSALNPIGRKRTLSENADPTANSHLLLDERTPPLRRHLNQHFRSTPSLAIMAAVNKIALNSPSRQNPSELETAIAGALFDLESNTQDLKATLRPLQFASAREVRFLIFRHRNLSGIASREFYFLGWCGGGISERICGHCGHVSIQMPRLLPKYIEMMEDYGIARIYHQPTPRRRFRRIFEFLICVRIRHLDMV